MRNIHLKSTSISWEMASFFWTAIGIFLSVTMVLMHQAEYLKRQIGKPAQKGV